MSHGVGPLHSARQDANAFFHLRAAPDVLLPTAAFALDPECSRGKSFGGKGCSRR
jgi:hypothetical protein